MISAWYLIRTQSVKNLNRHSILPFSEHIVKSKEAKPGEYRVEWGDTKAPAHGCVIETGFFWDAIHIDTCGLYQESVLSTPEGIQEIRDFVPPEVVTDRVPTWRIPSKYKQPHRKKPATWDGVVLAAQQPHDRSIRAVGAEDDYWAWFESTCRYFGKRLFIKPHPWNRSEVRNQMNIYARRYGCHIELADHLVIRDCEFVVVYNSTFAVDCFVRGVPVVQWAPGYFYRTGAVKFTDRAIGTPTDVEREELVERGRHLAEFLAWRYCFNISLPVERWVALLRAVEASSEHFPVPHEFAYAHYLLRGDEAVTGVSA